jgi:hypothetical protein
LLTCQEIVNLVTEYLEDSMNPQLRVSFEKHVTICPACRAFLSQMRETIRISGQIRSESLSPQTRDALLETFRDWNFEA